MADEGPFSAAEGEPLDGGELCVLEKTDDQMWSHRVAWCTSSCSSGQEQVEEHTLVKMLVSSAHRYILSLSALFGGLKAVPEGN